MSWKKAVFYGGAVLVLAACDNATAPTSPSALTKVNGISASAVKKTAATPTTTSSDSTTTTTSSEETCSSYLVHVGLDGTLTLVCAPTEW
jgi:hypothetical protein